MNQEIRKRNVDQKRKCDEVDVSNKSISVEVNDGYKLLKYFAVFLVLITVVMYVAYVTSPIHAVAVNDLHYENMKLEGIFALNEDLTNGIRIPMSGPESIVEDSDGNLYTGLLNGSIVKIHPTSKGNIGLGKLEIFATLDLDDDDATANNNKHGRGLGLRLKNNVIYGIDGYHGVFTLNLESRHIERLVKLCDANPCMKFPDDLEITDDENYIYFTDLSSEFSFKDIMYAGLDGKCSGRVFEYSLRTKQLKMVMDNLCMPNGVQLSNDEKTLMVAETTKLCVSWIDIRTWKRKYIQYLPAMPDNIRRSHTNTFFVAASSKITFASKFMLSQPILRQIAASLITPSVFYRLVNQHHNVLFEIDDQGKILRTLHDPNGKITFALSQATALSDGRVALGTFRGDFMSIAVIEQHGVTS